MSKPKRKFYVAPNEVLIHLVAFFIVLASPLLFFPHRGTVTVGDYFRGLFAPIMLCIVFYINYVWIVRKTLAHGNKKDFYILNTIIILAIAIFMNYVRGLYYMRPVNFHPDMLHPHPGPEHGLFDSHIIFFLRDIVMLSFSAALGTMFRVSVLWHHSESKRKEAELGQTEAELKNLLNQINPHFLLNTLNNIYALIEFNQEKAQDTVHQLSLLLRHVLYENQKRKITLVSEVEFLKSYVELMKLRVADNVEIKEDISIPEDCALEITPHIFICLVENAFKHGISPVKMSFIHITIRVDQAEQVIYCKIANSNFPKSKDDKSGSGMGLVQVQNRLDLLYQNNYSWVRGQSNDNTSYVSTLIIHTSPR